MTHSLSWGPDPKDSPLVLMLTPRPSQDPYRVHGAPHTPTHTALETAVSHLYWKQTDPAQRAALALTVASWASVVCSDQGHLGGLPSLCPEREPGMCPTPPTPGPCASGLCPQWGLCTWHPAVTIASVRFQGTSCRHGASQFPVPSSELLTHQCRVNSTYKGAGGSGAVLRGCQEMRIWRRRSGERADRGLVS